MQNFFIRDVLNLCQYLTLECPPGGFRAFGKNPSIGRDANLQERCKSSSFFWLRSPSQHRVGGLYVRRMLISSKGQLQATSAVALFPLSCGGCLARTNIPL